jgi:hypothetical protein
MRIGISLEFENKQNHAAFKLIIIIVLFGVCESILILNYFDVPKISEDKSYRFGEHPHMDLVKQDFIWSIDFNDKTIGNMENIIIYVTMLYGILRLIDLMYFLEKYNNE